MKVLLLFMAVLLVLSSTATVHTSNRLWPKPANLTYDPQGENVTVSPCNIKYVVESPGQPYVEEIISLYQVQIFKCVKIVPGNLVMNIIVKNTDQFIATDLKHEKYTLSLKDGKKWVLSADYYAGFLRAF